MQGWKVHGTKCHSTLTGWGNIPEKQLFGHALLQAHGWSPLTVQEGTSCQEMGAAVQCGNCLWEMWVHTHYGLAVCPSELLFSPKDEVRMLFTWAACQSLVPRREYHLEWCSVRWEYRVKAAGRPWKRLNNTKHLCYLFLRNKKNKGISEKRNLLESMKPICSAENYTVG